MRTSQPAGNEIAAKLALTVGFLALAAGVAVAHRAPPSTYELSIYAGTPLGFWLALLVVAMVATAVALRDDRHLPLALLLGCMGSLSVAGLPLLRGYHFFGRADSLVHLGWTREINVGGDPFSLFYPGSHLLSATLSMAAGIEITQAMLTIMVLFVLLFLLCVPLCVWFIVPDRQAFAIGAFSAFLLLPINNISTHLHFHTYSITMLFVPFVLYLMLTHLLDGESRDAAAPHVSDGGRVARVSTHVESVGLGLTSLNTVPTSYLLPLVSLGLVLFHSQVALNVLILFAGVVAVQLWSRRYRPQHTLGEYRLLALQTGVLLVLFVLWIQAHDGAFVRTVGALVDSVLQFVEGSAETTPRVESQADSANAIGVSIWTMFVKLFGIEAIYALIAGGLFLDVVTGWSDRVDREAVLQPSADIGGDVLVLLLFGGLALVPFFALHFLGSISTYLFRHVGFSMMLATILGAVGLRYLSEMLPEPNHGSRRRQRGRVKATVERLLGALRGGRPVIVLVVVVVLSLSVASVFASPFIYLPGGHVSEAEMDGYEAAFASQSPDSPVWFSGVRTSTDRYEQALYGAESAPWSKEVQPNPTASAPLPAAAMVDGLPTYFATHPEPVVRRDHYVTISKADRDREIEAYRGLRYSETAFASVDAQPDVSRVRDNGELTVYYVAVPEESAAGNDPTADQGGTEAA